MKPSENNTIIYRLQEGDTKSFEYIFKSHYKKLIVFANRYLNELSASEEIVSQLFTHLWEKGHEIHFTGSISAYLFRSVQNRCLNQLKKRNQVSLYASFLEREHQLENDVYEAERAYLDKEMSQKIHLALETLPSRCKEIFLLSRFEDMKYKDIADHLGLSQKTIERQIGIALEKLRKLLKK